MIRMIAVGLMLLTATDLATAGEAAAPGLRAAKPEAGPVVETGQGFMVPYTVTIPGSQASFEMMPIPGGEVLIGSPESEPGRSAVEGPQFTVRVEPFWMSKTEVTWAEYQEYMKLYVALIPRTGAPQKYRIDAVTVPTPLYDPENSFRYGDDPQLPAVTMTQLAAKHYTKWLSGITGEQYRLPTEAEWEYACRAGAATAYSFGDDPAQLDNYAWHAGNSGSRPHVVAQKKPNKFGLHDMHGNVWEWVIDEFADYDRFAGKTLKAADAVNWPTKAWPRTVKGGSWADPAQSCRCASKMGSNDDEWKRDDPCLPASPWWYTSDPTRAVGFRILRPLNPAPPEHIARYWNPDAVSTRRDLEMRMQEGRGVQVDVDELLPKAVRKAEGER